jgi:hypothetical protein
MKCILFFRTVKQSALLGTVLFLSSIFGACSDIYDNIKEFSLEEIVYSAHFDTIFATPGYKRVEIDLLQEGRLPPSMMKLGKAEKTIVEYDTIVKVFDSVCSWVNIDSLTLPKLYRFKVYTANSEGAKSVPLEVALTPYTEVDRQALKVPSPTLSTVSSFVVVRWEGGLNSTLMDFLSLSYSYTDKEGVIRTGTSRNAQFFVTNIAADAEVMVDVRYWVIPKLNGQRILDSVWFDQSMEVSMAAGTTPIEFTVSPTKIGLIPGRAQAADVSLKYGLSWTSSDTKVATVNTNGVIIGRAPGKAVITVKSEAIEEPATVEVTVTDVGTTPLKEQLTGMWTFENTNIHEEAAVGFDLIPSGSQRNFTSVTGPRNTKAVGIGTNSYYTLTHNIALGGNSERVNEYTLMMDVMAPTDAPDILSLFNTRNDNLNDCVIGLYKTLEDRPAERQVGSALLGGYSTRGLTLGKWHRVVVAVKLALNQSKVSVYIDGVHAWDASINIEPDGVMSLLPEKMYIGPDRDGRGYRAPQFAEVRTWSACLTAAQVAALGTP